MKLLEPSETSFTKVYGIPREHFHLFLKECEWRFNNSNPKTQQKILCQWVKEKLG
jgi:transposase